MHEPNWRKSSFSNGNGGANCVEVAGVKAAMLVRDSKDPAGPVLAFDNSAWRAFLGEARRGAFDRAP